MPTPLVAITEKFAGLDKLARLSNSAGVERVLPPLVHASRLSLSISELRPANSLLFEPKMKNQKNNATQST